MRGAQVRQLYESIQTQLMSTITDNLTTGIYNKTLLQLETDLINLQNDCEHINDDGDSTTITHEDYSECSLCGKQF